MKIPALLLVATSCLLHQQLSAQESQWETYMGQYEKGPGLATVDLNVKNKIQSKEFPFLLSTGIAIQKCKEDGLPEADALPVLDKVSAAVRPMVNALAQNIFTGTFTYQCERLDHFYVKDTSGIREKLTQLFRENFPGEDYRINIKPDPIWQDYLDFLYPNAVSLEFILNEKILAKQKAAGDSLEKERPVNHVIYFKNETDVNCFTPYVLKQKFKIVSKEKITDTRGSIKLVVTKTNKIDLATISAITMDLKRMAMRCNAEYDKWECEVVK